MGKMGSTYYKYSDSDVLYEAYLFCVECKSMLEISRYLKVPRSTVSWHLLYPLKDIDYMLWTEVRRKCIKHAKKPRRYIKRDDMNAIAQGATERIYVLMGGSDEND